ncbi:MAG: hypothetical protein ACRDRG_00565 [Pseudonocardiaceae bacterium]
MVIDFPGALPGRMEVIELWLGDRFVAGYVLYTGQQNLPFGEKIRAVPMDALWRLAP